MFRDQGTGYQERVDVIGNKKFIEFVEQLEKEEDFQLDSFEVGKDKVVIINVAPDSNKLDKDISLPVLSPILVRKKSLEQEIAELEVQAEGRRTSNAGARNLAILVKAHAGLLQASTKRLNSAFQSE